MILGIGTDITEVVRFNRWSAYPKERLLKIFSEQEFIACLRESSENTMISSGIYYSEKLAVRFAAKEAFYKALSSALVKLKKTQKSFSFLSIARHVQVYEGQWGIPLLDVDWAVITQLIDNTLPDLSIQVSLSHEKSFALAFVIIFS